MSPWVELRLPRDSVTDVQAIAVLVHFILFCDTEIFSRETVSTIFCPSGRNIGRDEFVLCELAARRIIVRNDTT